MLLLDFSLVYITLKCENRLSNPFAQECRIITAAWLFLWIKLFFTKDISVYDFFININLWSCFYKYIRTFLLKLALKKLRLILYVMKGKSLSAGEGWTRLEIKWLASLFLMEALECPKCLTESVKKASSRPTPETVSLTFESSSKFTSFFSQCL